MTETTPQTPKLTVHLTTEELAARLQVSIGLVKKWRMKGGGPRFLKFGARVSYPLTEIEAWEKTRLKRNTAD